MPLVILFLKAPEKGRVKTRLASGVGTDMALDLYRLFVETTLARLAPIAPVRIAYTPTEKRGLFTDWLKNSHDMRPQKGRDLGARMHHCIRQAFADGHTRVILMGGDIPDLPISRIHDAFEVLKRDGTVFVPTLDGGYCLVGARKGTRLAPIFEKMRWSHEGVMADTLQRGDAHGIGIRLLQPWQDIDRPDDLLAFVSRHDANADLPRLYREAARRINDGGHSPHDGAHGHAGEDEAHHP